MTFTEDVERLLRKGRRPSVIARDLGCSIDRVVAIAQSIGINPAPEEQLTNVVEIPLLRPRPKAVIEAELARQIGSIIGRFEAKVRRDRAKDPVY